MPLDPQDMVMIASGAVLLAVVLGAPAGAYLRDLIRQRRGGRG